MAALMFKTKIETGQTFVHEYGDHIDFVNDDLSSSNIDIDINDEVLEAYMDEEEIDLFDEDINTVADLQMYCRQI